uniref:N-acetyllactosaminide beta-1,6-N-acetylglucosaminyl-transferase-like isoform X2 n=1 Tax=Styela clava TaxID=7725 RepID=UPI00193AC6D4|nr:N-acetyllactosaminide beta-1,6-N-acetylglucosaminyl-transferase-like isoform X2 [Styela clava]
MKSLSIKALACLLVFLMVGNILLQLKPKVHYVTHDDVITDSKKLEKQTNVIKALRTYPNIDAQHRNGFIKEKGNDGIGIDGIIEHDDAIDIVPKKNIVSDECRIILNGDLNGIKKLRENNLTTFPWSDVTSDDEIIKRAADCTELKKIYRFPPFVDSDFTVTEEELEFPIAYSVLMHENIEQLLLLLSAIYREHNIHCIHLDAKASPETYKTLEAVTRCFPNVFLSTQRQRVIYAAASRLLADIACMRDLLAVPQTMYDWKYLINLCSQDFPMRTNKEIVQQLKVFRGHNSIGGYSELNSQVKPRTQFIYKIVNETEGETMTEKIIQTKEKHPPPPFNMTVMKNLAYNLYTREFLQWALIDGEVGPALLEWSLDTYSPDEHFWIMLHHYPEAPGGSSLLGGYQLARMIKWSFNKPVNACHGEWRHYICVYGAEDIFELTKDRREFFINKLDARMDSTGTECMRQWLDERSILPNEERKTWNPDLLPHIPSDAFYSKERKEEGNS